MDLEKTCGVCDFENVCLDEPMDANECNGFRNFEITKMENAIKVIEESNWLKDHDEKIRAEERANINKSDILSHSEADILKECIKLMRHLVRDFQEWYEWVHGENAVAELDEDERFVVSRSYFHIVQRLFLLHTTHGGGSSTAAKCRSLGVDFGEDIDFGFEVEENE